MSARTTVLVTVAVLMSSSVATGGMRGPEPWSEGFESYPVGPLAGQGGWEPWDGAPSAAGFEVTEEQARTGARSLAITGLDDAVRALAGVTSGIWSFSVWTWVSSTMDDFQYLQLLNQFGGPGGLNEWGLTLAFDGAAGLVQDVTTGGTTGLTTDEWVQLEVIIDLDANQCEILYGGALVASRVWAQSGTTTLEAVDLFGDRSPHTVYYDDFDLAPVGSSCPWDLDGDGIVGFSDLLEILSIWGPCPGCRGDFDGNDDIGFTDLLAVLSNWGPCPIPPRG